MNVREWPFSVVRSSPIIASSTGRQLRLSDFSRGCGRSVPHFGHRLPRWLTSAPAHERASGLYDWMAGYGVEPTLERPRSHACDRPFLAVKTHSSIERGDIRWHRFANVREANFSRRTAVDRRPSALADGVRIASVSFRLSIAAIQTAGCPAGRTAGHGPVHDLADGRDARSPIRVYSRDPVLKMLPGGALPDRQSAACRVCEVCAGFRSSSVSRACRSDGRRASVPSPGPV